MRDAEALPSDVAVRVLNPANLPPRMPLADHLGLLPSSSRPFPILIECIRRLFFIDDKCALKLIFLRQKYNV